MYQHLAWGQKRHQPFIEIILLLTIDQVIAAFFQGYDIQIKHHSTNIMVISNSLQINYTDLRMVVEA
jgi:hypothetical protein